MFVTVASSPDPIHAHILRGLLVAEGLDARVDDGQNAIVDWHWRLAIGGAKLRVPAAQAERAREVLRAHDAGHYALADTPATLPCRESWSSRIALAALFLFAVPLPWSRRGGDDDAPAGA